MKTNFNNNKDAFPLSHKLGWITFSLYGFAVEWNVVNSVIQSVIITHNPTYCVKICFVLFKCNLECRWMIIFNSVRARFLISSLAHVKDRLGNFTTVVSCRHWTLCILDMVEIIKIWLCSIGYILLPSRLLLWWTFNKLLQNYFHLVTLINI